MANKNSNLSNGSQNKDFKNSGAGNDFSTAFWSSVKKYRFTSITILVILLYFLYTYANDIFG